MKTKVNQGNGPQPKVDRNKQLIADFRSGEYTTAEMVAKYGISMNRIYYIIKRAETSAQGGKDVNDT